MEDKSKKIFSEEFEKQNKLSKKKKWEQVIQNPFHVFLYFVYTRLPFLIQKPIRGKARMFYKHSLEGDFPDPVFSHLYLYGFLEEDLTKFLIRFLKPRMTFIDIGAHIGTFSSQAAFFIGASGKIHAFEATPRTYELLRRNLEQFPYVQTNLLAVWSKKTSIKFFDYGSFYAQCNSFTKAKLTEEVLQKIKPKKITVPTTTVDIYCTEKNLFPDFIKIDAESAEYDILQGMKETLKKAKPIISLEIGDVDVKGKKGSKDCIQFLMQYGYVPFHYINGKMVKHILRENYKNIFDNLIFVHKTKRIIL